MKTAVEMTGPTAATKQWKVENQKQVSHFPTAYGFPCTANFRKEAWRRSFAPSPGSLFD